MPAAHCDVTTLEGVKPLGSQFGQALRKTVPDALHDAVFAQPAKGGAAVQTYAILDAARVVNLPELLESSGLEHACLIKGKARDELSEVTPWIVRLEDGNDFVRGLFSHDPDRDVPWFLWSRQPGILVRAAVTLAQAQAHFRRFIRVQDARDAWIYLRFWDPAVALDLAACLDPGHAQELFGGYQVSVFDRQMRFHTIQVSPEKPVAGSGVAA